MINLKAIDAIRAIKPTRSRDRKRAVRPAMQGDVVVGYVRVSTEEQELSPVAQRAAIEGYAKAHGWTLAAVYEDIGVSGGAPADRRPGFMALLNGIVEHDARVVVVSKLDRLSRDIVFTAIAERLFLDTGTLLRSVASEGTEDPNDPGQWLQRTLLTAFAQYERMQIRMRTKTALAVRKGRGQRVGSVPFGYEPADKGVAMPPASTERTGCVLAMRLASQGWSMRRIAATLTEIGVPPRSAHAQTISRMISAAVDNGWTLPPEEEKAYLARAAAYTPPGRRWRRNRCVTTAQARIVAGRVIPA